ncbi:hypothetical protein [uncultured Halomonas sp.]|uniref:hypothetical protein n=1 Tax=uncultured Halomonas sp. TaxID=173971 RepID=UPI00260BF8F6|nr:hypothetical protein [uncultured Halomonas sp.]
MKIRWPSFSLPPINLWNAPHQPALEDTMTEAAKRDAVQDQLCARIEELEIEKEALATQVDRLEEQLANTRGLGEALQRIGSTLDLDPGTNLPREAPARVEALAQQLSKAERRAEYESQSFRTLCFAIQRMEEIVGIDSGGYNGPGPALDAIERIVAERDALAAHVVRLMGALELARDRISMLAEIATDMGADVYAALVMWPEEMEQTLAETPATSLARLKAQWQAEALEQARRVRNYSNRHDVFEAIPVAALEGELRRQAEGET